MLSTFFSAAIFKTCFSAKSATFKEGSTAYLAGWGFDTSHWLETDELPYTENLTVAELPVVSNKECQKIYTVLGRTIEDFHMCAGYIGGGLARDGCSYDSGSGLMFDKTEHIPLNDDIKCQGPWILAGILNGGRLCGNTPITPSYYTRVSNFVQWIEDKINEGSDRRRRDVAQPTEEFLNVDTSLMFFNGLSHKYFKMIYF